MNNKTINNIHVINNKIINDNSNLSPKNPIKFIGSTDRDNKKHIRQYVNTL